MQKGLPDPTTNPPDPDQRTAIGVSYLIVALIAACVGVEIILLSADWGVLQAPGLRLTVYRYAGFWPGLLQGPWAPNYPYQQWLMFFTHAFLHSGPIHLIFNMLTLWYLGHIVYRCAGTVGFATVYGFSVIAGGIAFGILSPTVQPMVGASGGLFGLIGSIMAWNYNDRANSAQTLWPVALGIGGLVLLNLVQWWLMNGLLAWEAHLGGFLSGWILGHFLFCEDDR